MLYGACEGRARWLPAAAAVARKIQAQVAEGDFEGIPMGKDAALRRHRCSQQQLVLICLTVSQCMRPHRP